MTSIPLTSFSEKDAALDLCAFINASPSPWHAAEEAVSRLHQRGFRELAEDEVWSIAPQERCFVRRDGGTLIAFVPGRRSLEECGVQILAAHTDSPNLRVKPAPEVLKQGYKQVSVEVYGGVLLSTWMDRDLSLAGRVQMRREGKVETRLVDWERPIARIPNLAIHLGRTVNTDGLVLNAQKHMVPIVGLGDAWDLKRELGVLLNVDAGDVLGFDLCFYETHAAQLWGMDEEFVVAGRLDNLGSSHSTLMGFLASIEAETNCDHARMVVLYDHEECGSRTASGAGGSMLRDVLERLIEATGGYAPSRMVRAMQHSFLVSADMAHAIHPNYPDLHEPGHIPRFGGGLVIKSNANQSYATSGETAARFELVCRELGAATQKFVVRSDLPCGSTVGPIVSSAIGLRTVDVGAPMLSMHSCRETAGVADVKTSIRCYEAMLSR